MNDIQALIDQSPLETAETVEASKWGTPTPIQEVLFSVEELDLSLVPNEVRAWVQDEAERLQVKPDFIAVSLMVVLSSVIGRQVAIRPKAKDDWIVVPNLWGMIIGRPASFKTPSVSSVLKPLTRLQALSIRENEQALNEFQAFEKRKDLERKVLTDKLKRAMKVNPDTVDIEAETLAIEEKCKLPPKPACKRYIANDITIQKLGELLRDNPNGVLVFRDELSAFFHKLDKEGHDQDRSFFLEAWNGTNSYSDDTISRGTVYIESCCVSVFGGIQPDVLGKWLADAIHHTGKDDGFMQRFQLMVYPDPLREIKSVDRYPNTQAKNTYFELVKRLSTLSPEVLGCIQEDEELPYLRFTPEAQAVFDDWYLDLRQGFSHHAGDSTLEAHFIKYSSLVPSLALICHLANGYIGSVSKEALVQALAWSEYLASHAKRIYALGQNHHVKVAHALLKRVKAKELNNPFTLREIKRKHWKDMNEAKTLEEALDTLEEHGYLRKEESRPLIGRPSVQYYIHPRLLGEEAGG
ncbi:MAG: YfjI family protein [Vampirovibrionales bacterium]